MPKLLVVDPLDLSLFDDRGAVRWSSRSCFTASLAEEAGVLCEYTTAKDPHLCRRARESDGVILGGSAESAWEDTAYNDHLLDLIAICRNSEVPFLGICYGAQLLGRALGGHVARHPDGIELGTTSIRISQKGRRHFLFRGIGETSIQAVETHNDAVLTLPPECELLASTQHTPVQAFSFHGLLNGVQFHPEMDGNDLRFLWRAFECSGVVTTVSQKDRDRIESCECPRLGAIIRNFVSQIRAGGATLSERCKSLPSAGTKLGRA